MVMGVSVINAHIWNRLIYVKKSTNWQFDPFLITWSCGFDVNGDNDLYLWNELKSFINIVVARLL